VAALELADASAFDAAYLVHSDVGDVLAQLFRDRREIKSLTLEELAASFEAIERARGTRAKEGLAAELLRGMGPLSAKYVGKILTGDLRIGLKEGLVEDAVAEAFEQPAEAIRRAHLLNGDLAQVAVAAKHGQLAEVRLALFQPLKSMLATAESTPEAIAQRLGHELWVEDKFDGIRAQAHKEGDRLELYSRDLKSITGQFPEVRDALAQLPGSFILDGELLAARGGAPLPFVELQKRLGRKELTPEVLAAAPVVYVAFDCLYRDGEALLDAPLRVRRAALEALPLGKIDNGYFFESDMLFRLYTVRAVVRDVPLRARYAGESSNLRIGRVLRDFPGKYVSATLKRIFYSYFLRDFNAGTLQLASGLLLLSLGTAYGVTKWINSSVSGFPTTSGAVMLAALPVLVGVQLLLGALQFDIQNVPRTPLCAEPALAGDTQAG
jgi:hypothetical protein